MEQGLRATARILLLASLAIPLLGGCASGDSVPNHTADEQKLVDQMNRETPEQKIERIQKGPMPEAAKQAMIQKIKKENGLK